MVSALLAAGQSLHLAGLGCPPDFHRRLLAEIAGSRLLDGDRHTVIITAHAGRGQADWEWTTARLSRASQEDQPAQRYPPYPRALPWRLNDPPASRTRRNIGGSAIARLRFLGTGDEHLPSLSY